MVYQAKRAGPKDGDAGSESLGEAGQKGGRGMGGMPFFTNAVQMNLC